MRITVSKLRELVIKEMKLGVAGAHAAGEAWGNRDEPDPEPDDPTYIATDIPNFDPDEETRALYSYRGQHVYDMAGDPIEEDADPFPVQKSVTLMDAAPSVTQTEELLRTLGDTLDAAAKGATNPSARATVHKAAGLVRHAWKDIKATQAMMMAALEDMMV